LLLTYGDAVRTLEANVTVTTEPADDLPQSERDPLFEALDRLEDAYNRGFDRIGTKLELLIAYVTRTGGVSPTGG
jgi:hypothetical protein